MRPCRGSNDLCFVENFDGFELLSLEHLEASTSARANMSYGISKPELLDRRCAIAATAFFPEATFGVAL